MKLNVQDLIDQGLVKKKTYTEGKYKYLSVLKYSRKVFYDNLWHLDDRLLECRGTVVDEDWNVIVLPFKKVFNHGENGTWVADNRNIIAVEKMNGFMAAATMTEKYGLIISTTGSLESEFAKLAEKWVIQGYELDKMMMDCTYLFEICDKSDPHIVEEKEGAYLIGLRFHNEENNLTPESCLDIISSVHGYKRPAHFKCKFKDLPETKKEGWMIRDAVTEKVLCKLKSPHYLSKKLIIRLSNAKVDFMFDKPEEFKKWIKDEEFFEFVDYMAENIDKEVWKSYNDQQRRDFIERYYGGY